MVKIIAPAKKLVTFFMLLQLRFSKPQISHALHFIEGSIMLDGTKTLSAINRSLLKPNHPSSMADFFTYSPWEHEEYRKQYQQSLIQWAVEDKQRRLFRPFLLLSIDDSLSKKPKESKHFTLVDWHFDAKEGKRYAHGISFITLHLQCGNRSIPINWRIYLKAKTVRRLNRDSHMKIPFKSKMVLAIEMLEEIKPYLPEGFTVYVLFDSWYASKELIQFCRTNNWHLIGGLRSNRSFQGKKLSRIARSLRERDFTRVWVDSAKTSTLYWTCLRKGKLKGIVEEVSVVISKRHRGDKRPEFFLCTDLSLSAKQALSLYTRRWAIEVDYLYLKTRLGLGDFRVRSMEGIERYFTLTFISLAYLAWRKAEEGVSSISEVIALHRKEQYEEILRAFGRKVIERESVELALEEFLPKAA